MVAVFATMTAALVAARWGPRWLALAALFICLALSAAEFMWDIYDAQDGFRLPWLQA